MSTDGPFVRERELQRVMNHINECIEARRGSVIKLHADAGAGKSRLLEELGGRLRRDHVDALYLLGRARASQASTNSYHPFRRAVESLKALPSKKRGGLKGAIRSVWDHDVLADLPWVGPFLAMAETMQKGYSDPTSTLTSHLDKSLIEFFGGLAQHTSVVLALDDMHWTDTSSAELLTEIAETHSHVPLILVVAYRNSDIQLTAGDHPLQSALSALHRYQCIGTEVTLDPIGSEDIALFAQGFKGAKPSDRLEAWLTDISAGNPFFLEEYLALLEDRDAITVVAGEVDWASDEIAAGYSDMSEVPQNIGEVLEARLRLTGEPEAAEMLQAACVLTGPFDGKMVAELGDFDVASTRRTLSRVCKRSGLIRDTEDGYVFWHNLVRVHFEGALRSDDGVAYRELHAAAADILDARPHTPEILSTVARHLHEAGLHQRAAAACLGAAAAITQVGGLYEANHFAEWARDHAARVGDPRCEIEAAIANGRLLLDLRRIHEAKEALEVAELLAISHEIGGTAELYLQMAKAFRMENRWADARERLHEANRVVDDADHQLRARIGLLTGEIALCGEPCDLGVARQVLETAAELTGDENELSPNILGHLALVLLADSDIAASTVLLSRAQAAAQIGSPADKFVVALFAAHIGLATLDLPTAEAAIDSMRSLADRYLIGRTDVERYQGRLDALAGKPGESANAYCRFLISDLRLGEVVPEARTWVLSHLTLQAEELKSLRSASEARQFIQALRQAIVANATAFAAHAGEPAELLDVLDRALETNAGRLYQDTAVSAWHHLHGGWNSSARSAYDFYCADLSHIRSEHPQA